MYTHVQMLHDTGHYDLKKKILFVFVKFNLITFLCLKWSHLYTWCTIESVVRLPRCLCSMYRCC